MHLGFPRGPPPPLAHLPPPPPPQLLDRNLWAVYGDVATHRRDSKEETSLYSKERGRPASGSEREAAGRTGCPGFSGILFFSLLYVFLLPFQGVMILLFQVFCNGDQGFFRHKCI